MQLIKEWEYILYYENPIQNNPLSKTKEKQISNYSNLRYWESLKPKNFTYHLKEYRKIVMDHTNQTQNKITKIIKNKIDELNTNPIQINHLDIGLKRIVSTNQNCIITGLDISMQKEGSFLLSHTGLKYYYAHNRKLFDEVKNKYLSVKWFYADTETQIKEIAHNIRNKVSITRIKQIKMYKPSQLRWEFN